MKTSRSKLQRRVFGPEPKRIERDKNLNEPALCFWGKQVAESAKLRGLQHSRSTPDYREEKARNAE